MSVFKHVPGLMLLFFSSISLFAQEQNTIQFTDASFNEALQAASKNGKLVFVDCYTSWCAPCKWMEKNVFVNDTVYQFFNKQFVNFKVDMEKGEGVQLREPLQSVFFSYLSFFRCKRQPGAQNRLQDERSGVHHGSKACYQTGQYTRRYGKEIQ